MGNAGTAAGHLHRALEQGLLLPALAAAGEIGGRLSLDHAFVLVLLMRHDRRYSRAAARWVGRLSVEKGLELGEMQLLLELLRAVNDDQRLRTVAPGLASLLRERGLKLAVARLEELAAGTWPRASRAAA